MKQKQVRTSSQNQYVKSDIITSPSHNKHPTEKI